MNNMQRILRSPSPTVRSCRYAPMFWKNLMTQPARWQKSKDGNSWFLQNTVP